MEGNKNLPDYGRQVAVLIAVINEISVVRSAYHTGRICQGADVHTLSPPLKERAPFRQRMPSERVFRFLTHQAVGTGRDGERRSYRRFFSDLRETIAESRIPCHVLTIPHRTDGLAGFDQQVSSLRFAIMTGNDWSHTIEDNISAVVVYHRATPFCPTTSAAYNPPQSIGSVRWQGSHLADCKGSMSICTRASFFCLPS